ncbi:MAG: hypothetical protein LBL98_08020 [Ruminococcus sp.]|jgi:bacteriocin-like protein|nr:hypothetical protein [Ruminococcus sp.]
MKKEELIAKAREKGIELSDEQAEQYITLTDEELENIAGGSGQLFCEDPPAGGVKIADKNQAQTCRYYRTQYNMARSCENCDFVKFVRTVFASDLYCTVSDAFKEIVDKYYYQGG